MSASPLSGADGVAAVQRAFDEGRYEAACRAAAALEADPVGGAAALRLRCLAAFRLGELDEAAQAAQRAVERARERDEHPHSLVDVYAVSVVAAGELARFDQALEHVQSMQSGAKRAGSLGEFVRARGSAATCFALLGDPWAGQRLLAELIGMFQAGPPDTRLEATVRTNHASVCLQVARAARQGGDETACRDAVEHAAASIERTREIARERNDARLAAFADVHAAEIALLCNEAAAALALLDGAAAQTDAAGLWAHSRQLRLLEAEALLIGGDAVGARAMLEQVARRLDAGHELGARIRWHAQMQRALAALGDKAGALDQQERARALAQYRQYRQAHAQSRYLRARLELEHMYRYRASAAR